jgi:hypothetical protein
MSIFRLFILIILIISGFFTISTAKSPTSNDANPKYISVTHTPCYIGCDYAFPYCYNYDISNMNDGIKVEKWEVDNGWVKGRAVVDINANFLVKLCYQVSLNNREYLINKGLNLEAEFDFKVRLGKDSPGGGINNQCIDEGESSISYSSFKLKGDLIENPDSLFSSIEQELIEEMKFIIRHSVCKAVYDSLMGDFLSGNELRKNIYCDTLQDESVLSTSPCECD